ncbi:hypothetical protein C1H46_041133 [Malus baccata]|uniref:Uncharacterized protein n=1 Tax=Malus baccata TaxID=106549 RepID=A0A540KGJ7_MALBA|nr:hypothetical protein C1H46_041133 [Malus baccata]
MQLIPSKNLCKLLQKLSEVRAFSISTNTGRPNRVGLGMERLGEEWVGLGMEGLGRNGLGWENDECKWGEGRRRETELVRTKEEEGVWAMEKGSESSRTAKSKSPP